MDVNSKQTVVDRVAESLEDYVRYYDDITSRCESGWPTFSQAIRISAFQKNRRILVADDTGVNGKTFVAVASKLELDRSKKKRHPALVIAPNSGMLNAWSESEINRYAAIMRSENQKVVTVRKYRDLSEITVDTDFVVLNWEKLSVKEDDNRWKELEKIVQKINPEVYVLDECHNAKGASSLRARSVRRLANYTKNNNLLLLSATPIPNRVRDLGALFHLLDPDKYENPAIFAHCGPVVMKELLERQVWFRLTRQDLKEELGLPDFIEREVPVNLTDDEAEIYFKGWSDCVSLGEGLTELRKALYDPKLSKYSGGKELGYSSKIKKAKELCEELTAKGHKIIVKTNFVKGVIETIIEALSHNSQEVLSMDASTSLEERRRSAIVFKNSDTHNILVTSPVGEESIDLTTGDVPCDIITLEPEMTPREFVQLTGRVYRRGQKGVVTHYSLVSKSPTLERLMISFLESLVEKYKVKVPKKFRPRTIDADMLAMRKAKELIIEKVYSGQNLSRKEERVYDADEVDRAVAHLEGLLLSKSFKSIKPFEAASLVQTRWRNLGEEQFERLVKSKGWRRWKNNYEDGWEGSASQATLELVGKEIDSLESRLGYNPRIIDMGSGAAYLSRATGRSVVCVDIDRKFLALGKSVCDKKGITNEYVSAKATCTGLKAAGADVVVNSYMIFYLGQDSRRNEVEQCVLETNRVLKKEGFWTITLPFSIDEQIINRFTNNLENYGFERTNYLSPKETSQERLRRGCHILTFKKTSNVRKAKGLDLSFYDGRWTFVA